MPLLSCLTQFKSEKKEKESREGTGGDSESDQPFGGRCMLGSVRVCSFEVERTKRRCDFCDCALVRYSLTPHRPFVQLTAGKSCPDSLDDSVLFATIRPIVERSLQTWNFEKCIIFECKITLSSRVKRIIQRNSYSDLHLRGISFYFAEQ